MTQPSVSLQSAVQLEKPSQLGIWLTVILAILLILAGILLWALSHSAAKSPQAASAAKQTGAVINRPAGPAAGLTATAQGLQLDTNKNYGNKYSNGILPVGDGKYSTSNAKTGYIYACSPYPQNLASGGGGANARGPWFINNSEYDLAKKVHVSGSVTWHSNISDVVSGSVRTISFNDLPAHSTGIFPIALSDPAHQYDHNPNSIKSQSLTYALTAQPEYGTPHCMGGEAGIMLTGAALFNAFDAGGRDAGAWEVQDQCGGHPQSSGAYHYHTLSSCIGDTSISTVIGFALDGFPITGPKLGPNNILTTSDLDECHGIVSQILLDGKSVTMYHYVMTADFPYSVSCFRSTPVQTTPEGQAPPSSPRTSVQPLQ